MIGLFGEKKMLRHCQENSRSDAVKVCLVVVWWLNLGRNGVAVS